MPQRDADPAGREERLDQVIAEFLEESGPGVAADHRRWLARYPEFYDELSDFFADCDEIEKLSAPLRDLARTADAEGDSEWLGPSEVPDHIGRLGPYEVVERLGRGGMGVVYKAQDLDLNRFVAIKALAPQWSTDLAARRRFTREAQAAAAVSHPHVITIHAVGEWRGRPYLVMEFVPGASLQHRIDEGGPMELMELLRIGVQAASGMAAAHAQGLIHRDIKPSNIMLENELARVKITDFGLARAVDDTRLTLQGTLAGTPSYMAPEQARGEPLDRRSDLFSLGSVLYAMATGRAAFSGESSVEVIRRVSDGDPPPVRELNPEVPGWLVEVIERLHAKDPADRFQTAGEVADLLELQLARLQDPSLPPVEHPWVRRRPSVAARVRDLARRASTRRLTVSVLLLAVAAGSGLWTRWVMQAQILPAHGDRPQATAPPEFDQHRLTETYHCDFRGGIYDHRWLDLEPSGPLSSLAKADERGLRIAIPAKTNCRGVGAYTRFGVHGDFEVTASFEILKAEKPREGGGVGPELYLRTVDGWSTFVAMTRMLRVGDDEPEFTAVWAEKIDGKPRYHVKHEKTDLKACRFRIARAGPTVRYLVAPKDSDSFREVSRNEFGTKDLDMVRVMGQVNGSAAALDVLWKDLTIRAEALPGLARMNSSEQGRPMSWIILSGLAGAAALGAGLWWNGARRAKAALPAKARAW